MKPIFKLIFVIIIANIYPNSIVAQNIDSCLTSNGTRTNLGIYGGTIFDFATSNTGRIFTAALGPFSLKISDDTLSTWYEAYPEDSLYYDCGKRGWGGNGVRVLTNSKGWVVANNEYYLDDDSLSAAVVSFNNGDTNTWSTMLDSYIIEQLTSFNFTISSIAITDYWIAATAGPFTFMRNDTSINYLNTFFDIRDSLKNLPVESEIINVALTNNPLAIPRYFVLDTTPNLFGSDGVIYKFGSNGYVNIAMKTIDPALKGIKNIFVHPQSINGDTLFVSGIDTLDIKRIYRSDDGGQNWIDLTPLSLPGQMYYLSDIDYSASWQSMLPQSNGIILFSEGYRYSIDMGNNWKQIIWADSIITNDPKGITVAVLQSDTNYVVASENIIPVLSTNGISSNSTLGLGLNYKARNNINLNAIEVYDIDYTLNKNEVYIATSAGLAYTKGFNDNTISYPEKWIIPYGKFPVDLNYALPTSVAVNPFDSLNVVVGNEDFFSVTTFGLDSFLSVNPGFGSDSRVNDIAFYDSLTVFAVTGEFTSSQYQQAVSGNIWLSINKGISWVKISPTGFSAGNTIDINYTSTDTIIYIGSGYKNYNPGYVWKSSDKGKTWLKLDGPPSSNDSLLLNSCVNDIVINPNSNDSIFVAAGNEQDATLVKSTDGGLTYKKIDLSNYSGKVYSVTINKNNPDSVYFVVGRDICLYVNSKDSVYTMYHGLPGELCYTIEKGSILVGTTTGFYVLNLDPIDDIVTYIIKASDYANQLILYPNPATDRIILNLLTQQNETIKEIEAFNVIGKKISLENSLYLNDDYVYLTIDNHFSDGIYYLKVHTNITEYSRVIIIKR